MAGSTEEVAEGTIREGTRIAGYVVGERLGAGGFGEVFAARHARLGRDVAIKVLHPRYSEDPETVERFAAEARAVDRISHPGIVRIYELGAMPDGREYIVMERLRGVTLRDVLRAHGRLPLAQALPILRAVAAAVDAAHAAGIAHRDLKPDNVFVLDDGSVKLIDFGLAKLLLDPDAPVTETGAVFGTPLYMSPEQCRAQKADIRSDAYSFGAMAYHVLVGDPPFRGDALEVGMQHVNAQPEPPRVRQPELPARVDDVLLALLAKDPAARPMPLSAAVAQLGGTAPPRATVPARRRVRMAVAALVALAIAAVAWFVVTRPAPGPAAGVRGAPPRIAVRAHGGKPGEPAWLVTATERMLRDELRGRPERAYWLDEATPDQTLEVAVERGPAGVELAIARAGVPLAHGTAASVAEAVALVVPSLGSTLDAGGPAAGPDAAELDGMHQIGARDVIEYRRWMRVWEDYSRNQSVDATPLRVPLRALAAADPAWGHAAGLLAVLEGENTPAATATLAAGLALVDARRDPSGAALLHAQDLGVTHGHVAAAVAVARAALTDYPRDPMIAWILIPLQCENHMMDDCVSIVRSLHETYPSLQFGGDLAQLLRRAGRTEEAHRVLLEWSSAHPEAEQALFERLQLALDEEHPDDARAVIAQLDLLFGQAPERLGFMCGVELVLGDVVAAHQLADRMLLGTPAQRAHGRYRMGEIAVVEGRFGAAYETLKRAAEENRPFGGESRLTQTLALLRSIAPLVGAAGDERRWTDELARAQATVGQNATAAAVTSFAATLIGHKVCPTPSVFLDALPEGEEREAARRQMIRASASAGCGSCAEVVAAGATADESDREYLVLYARCAEHEGDLDRAGAAYERAIRSGFYGEVSPVYVMRALLGRARVLARQGDKAGARAQLAIYLGRWGAADRPVPEVAEARKLAAELGAK